MEMAKLIYTSYYGNVRNLPPTLTQIAISRTQPDFWQPRKGYGDRIELRLAPSWRMFNLAKTLPPAEWCEQFREEATPGITEVFIKLPMRCVLLCWEKDWKECHRRVVWEVLSHIYPELEGGEYGAPKCGDQAKLF
jgi:hypothetical protein